MWKGPEPGTSGRRFDVRVSRRVAPSADVGVNEGPIARGRRSQSHALPDPTSAARDDEVRALASVASSIVVAARATSQGPPPPRLYPRGRVPGPA